MILPSSDSQLLCQRNIVKAVQTQLATKAMAPAAKKNKPKTIASRGKLFVMGCAKSFVDKNRMTNSDNQSSRNPSVVRAKWVNPRESLSGRNQREVAK